MSSESDTITKVKIAENISRGLAISHKKSEQIIEIIIYYLKKNIKNDNYISIVNFGRFILKSKKERMGRNPKTGQPMIIPARDVVLFHYSNQLRSYLKEKKPNIKPANFSNKLSFQISEHFQKINFNLDFQDTTLIVNIFFRTIVTSLIQKKRVEFRNFGIFKTKKHKGRPGRNPKTGQAIMVEPKVIPFFKYSRLFFN